MDIQAQVDYFKALPYETQKEKVLVMLKELKDTHEVFASFYTAIYQVDKVDSWLLEYIYSSILEIAEDIAQGKKEEANQKIDKMQDAIMKIRQQEILEKEQEWNPDNLLQNI